jgi:hypothetical protein
MNVILGRRLLPEENHQMMETTKMRVIPIDRDGVTARRKTTKGKRGDGKIPTHHHPRQMIHRKTMDPVEKDEVKNHIVGRKIETEA